MTRRTILSTVFILGVIFLISVRHIDAGKSSRRGGSSGWGFKSRSTPKSKPHQQQHQNSGSKPGTIGWNVPNQKPSGVGTGSSYSKPSAPNEQISKATATNVRSGYPSSGSGYNPSSAHNPSGGYNPSFGYQQPGSHSGYNPSGGYHQQPSYGGYNPSGGYHQPGGYGSYNPNGGYNPSYGAGHGFSNTPGHGYNPSYGHSSSFNAQPQTVILQSQSSRPGIGQLAKEAFVYAGVSAGVNAAVNRILPGGIYGHSSGGSVSSSGVVPPVTHTQITYNNYYNNGSEPQPAAATAGPVANSAPPIANSAPPAAVSVSNASPAQQTSSASNNQQQNQQPQQNNPSPSGAVISDSELQKFTENLLTKDTNNAFKFITIKTQGQKTDDSKTDDAVENLLEVKPEAYEGPTIKSLLALHDNYELDVKTKENLTPEKRREESDFLDAIISTDVMRETMKFLYDKGFVPNDEYEFKDTLKRIWFSQFKRVDGDASSSGFETVFLAEQFDNEIIGLHNWIYFAKQEETRKLNYLGYIKKVDFGTNGAIVKGRSSLNSIVQPITTIFVGTSPELEIALYTICFYIHPNNACPITLGGVNVFIVANRINYFGKDILISAFPDI